MKQIPFKAAGTVAACLLFFSVFTSTVQGQDLKPVPPENIAKIREIIPARLPAAPGRHRILVFWRCEGFVHGAAIEYGNEALRQLSAKHDAYKIDFSREYADLSADNLKKYDALVLMNTTRLNTKENYKLEYDLINYVKAGKGLCVIHAGADNFYEAEAAAEMVGGRFWGHPWGAGGTWAFTLDEPAHPINKSFPQPKFKWGDEIYQQESPFYNRAKLRVLVSLDMSDEATANAGGQRRTDGDYAVSWIRPYGDGRVFYTSFAHDQRAFLDGPVLTHIIAGLQYTVGDLKVDDTPGGLSDAEIAGIRAADETGLHKSFALLQDALRNTHNDKVLKTNLQKILPVLADKSATPQGKQAVLRALISCGIQPDPASVAPALADRESRNWAVTLLTGIDNRAATAILSETLASAKGADQVNLINAMAIRKNAAALIPLMNNTDDSVATAAISGVGRIADTESLKALLAFKTEKLKDTHNTALAACIGTMAAAGETKTAAKAARYLIDRETTPDAVKAACAKALLLDNPAFYSEGIVMKCSEVRETVARHADAVDNSVMAASLAKLDAAGKVAVITKLAAKNAKECAPAIASLLDAKEPEVVCAALKALCKIGSAADVPGIFEKLYVEDGSIRQVARFALDDMHCADTTAALIKAAGDNVDRQKIVLQIIGERMKKDELALVGTFLKSSDPGLRQEAWKTLGSISDESSSANLLALLPQIQQSDASRAASAINATIGNIDSDTRVRMLSEAWQSGSAAARLALIDVMLRYSDDRYIELIGKAMSDADRAVAESAIRTLGSWPSLQPYNDLVGAMQALADAGLKKAAYRGALKLAMAKGDGNAAAMCADLYRKAPSDADRETLAKLYFKERSIEVFSLLKNCFNDPACGAAAKRHYAALFNEQVKPNLNAAVGELDPKEWKGNASHGAGEAKNAYDRNPGSRWTSGGSKTGMWYTLDLGKTTTISEIVLDTTASSRDTPNGYEVYVSNDGQNWGTPVATGDGNSEKVTTIRFTASGRHVKIVTTGFRPGLHWSIHEIYIKAGLDPKTVEEIRKTAESL